MAEILVTGGAGFIGSNLVEALAGDPDNNVVVADNLLTGHREYVPERDNVEFVEADVNDIEQVKSVFADRNFDYVYHYAAVVGVQRTLEHPKEVLEDIQGIKNILELAKNGVKRVLYSSSSEVYGEPVEIPQHEETTPLNSRLPYAVVKNVGESYFRTYQKVHGLDYTIFRFFNTYGPHQSADFVVSRFLDAALEGKDIPVYGDGQQTRTFCYADDNVEATVKALKDEDSKNQVVNIGNDNEIAVVDLAKKIIQMTGSNSKIVHLPPLEEGDMTRRQPDVTRMIALLGRQLTPLEVGLQNLIDYKTKKPVATA